jgi:PAS domain S-box-containing protein
MNTESQPSLSLQVKAVVTAVGTLAALAALLMYFYGRQMQQAAEDALQKRAQAIATALASECEYGLLVGNKSLLQRAVVKALAQSDLAAVAVFDEQGRWMAAAGKTGRATAGASPAKPPARFRRPTFLRQSDRLALFYQPVVLQPASVTLDEDLDSALPQESAQIGRQLGLIELEVDLTSTQLAVRQARSTALRLTGLSALALSLLSLIVVRRMSRPLHRLVHGAQELAAGNLAARVPVSSRDEIGEVARAFNEMATSLQRSRQEILSYQRDLEKRVQARTEALRESEQRYRTLVEQLPAITYLAEAGQNGQWLYVSPQIESLLGFTLVEWLADPTLWVRQLHPDDRERVLARKRESVRRGEPFVMEYRMYARDGRLLWFSDRAVVQPNGSNQTPLLYGVMLDITELKQLQEQFLQAQKMEAVGRLAGGVAHDFNNILTAIQGYSEQARKRLDGDEVAAEYIHEVEKAAQRAASLTRQLLAFSRKQTLQPKVVDLNTVVAHMDKMLRRLIGEDIELVTRPGPDLGRVLVDPGQIEQVLMNLAVNAREAMPDGGKLTIETANVVLDARYAHQHPDVAPGPYVLLAVSDTGVGMTPEIKARVFEPFFTTKGAGRGTGLGLATCFGIVKQSGGHISVYSEPGHGTSFKIFLPRVEQQLDATPAPADSSKTHGGHETVLLVEDEPAVRELAALILSGLGYRVLTASNGADGLRVAEACEAGDNDLLLTDVVMPEMGGKELAERLLARHRHLRVLYTSGYTAEAIARHGVLEPDIAFLQKPYSSDALARKVREVLDNGTACAIL